MRKIRVEDLPVTVSPRGPKIRRVLSSDEVAMANVILEPGQELPAHVTPVDVFFYVRSGSGVVIVGDEKIEASDGDIVLSPKGIPHGLRASRSEEFSVLVVKTPNPNAQRHKDRGGRTPGVESPVWNGPGAGWVQVEKGPELTHPHLA